MAYGLFNPLEGYNKPKFWLAKPNKQIISRLKEIDSTAKLEVEFGKINQLNFTIPYSKEQNNKSIINPNLDKMKAKYLLKMKFQGNTEWFVIEQFSKEANELDSVPATAYSLQYELNFKKIYEIDVTSLTPEQIMDTVLDGTGWTVGTIDSVLASKYRSFQFSNTSVLDCLYQIAETYNGILQFDTVNQTISLYDEETVSPFNGLVLNDKNYIETLSNQKNASDIVTRLYPIGSEGLTVNSVNPSGTSYIEDFSYFLYPFERDAVTKETIKQSFYMTDELAHAILDLQELIESKKDEIATLSENKIQLQTELTELQNMLTDLESKLDIMNDIADIMKANKEFTSRSTSVAIYEEIELREGDHFIQMRATSGTASMYFDDIQYSLTTDWTNVRKNYEADKKVTIEIEAITGNGVEFYVARLPESELEWTDEQLQERYNYFIVMKQIISQRALVTGKTAQIALVDAELQSIFAEISIESNFTPEMLEERGRYTYEQYWIEDNHVDAKELYDDAVKQFNTINKPSSTMNISIINFLSMTGEIRNWNKLKIGSKLRVKYSKLNILSESILIGISFDFEADTIGLSISDTKDLLSDEERLVKMIYASSSSSNYLALKKFIYDDASSKVNAVKELLDETWDATARRIVAGANESIEIGKRGIVIQNPNYPNDILVAQAGVLAISNDGGLSFKNALTTSGLVAERILGQIIISEKVWIEDDNGIITMRGDLQEIKDALGDVKIKLGQYENGKFGLQVLDGALDVRTSGETNRGVNINADGIKAFNETNQETFYVDSTTGEVGIIGRLLIKTLLDPNSGLEFDGTSLRAFNTEGVKVFEVTTTGEVLITGFASFIDLITEGQTIIHGNNIETGTMNWDRAKGGTLTLGGAGGQNGTLVFTDEEDVPVVNFDAASRGFDYLNVVNFKSDTVVSHGDSNFTYYVASAADTGVGAPSDDNDGLSLSSPLPSIASVRQKLPKNYDGICTIFIAYGQTLTENIEFHGFSGKGKILIDGQSAVTKINGDIDVQGCSLNIEFRNIRVNATGDVSPAFRIERSSWVKVSNFVMYGYGAGIGIASYANSFVELIDARIYDTAICISSRYGSTIFVSGDCNGYGSSIGMHTYGGYITGSGTGFGGATFKSNIAGGQNFGSHTSPTTPDGTGTTVSETPVVKKKIWESTSGATYQELYNQWNLTGAYAGYVAQGKWGTATGILRGAWFFGSGLSTTVTGKTIKSIRVYIARKGGGYESAQNITIKPHSYTTRPAGEPSYLTPSHNVQMKWGEGKWVTLPTSFHAVFANGTAKGIGVYNGAGSYSKQSSVAKIEISYED